MPAAPSARWPGWDWSSPLNSSGHPFVDRLPLPGLKRLLGRRRSWMLVGQLGIVAALASLSVAHPAANLLHVAVSALLLAFFSVTQDIALDAWRIESATDAQQGAMAAAYQIGYRAAIICSTAGALGLAQVAAGMPATPRWRGWVWWASLPRCWCANRSPGPQPSVNTRNSACATGWQVGRTGRPSHDLWALSSWAPSCVR
ncbi:MAG: hypothetical protein WDM77_15650 [Steroidobacteraceae bacterium]